MDSYNRYCDMSNLNQQPMKCTKCKNEVITTDMQGVCDQCSDGKTWQIPTEKIVEDAYKNLQYVDHPRHYNQYPVEVIDMMEAIWGPEKVMDFCLMNAFKYRMRLGHKDNYDQDLAKEQWYLDKAKEYRQKLEENNLPY